MQDKEFWVSQTSHNPSESRACHVSASASGSKPTHNALRGSAWWFAAERTIPAVIGGKEGEDSERRGEVKERERADSRARTGCGRLESEGREA